MSEHKADSAAAPADGSKEIDQASLDAIAGGTGAGDGKVTFNPFSVTKKIDGTTPQFGDSSAVDEEISFPGSL